MCGVKPKKHVIHNHEVIERIKGIDEEHVIIDRDLFERLLAIKEAIEPILNAEYNYYLLRKLNEDYEREKRNQDQA